jgi:hypothetical protein
MSLAGMLVLVLAIYAAFKVAGAFIKTLLWVGILLFAWWYFGPQIGIPFPFSI